MLQSLSIRNIAVIEKARIEFGEGLNILSGETGAGKSIIIDSISLILGSRGSAEWIRSGCDEAVIEGLFDLSAMPWMRERLLHLGFSAENQELLIKRILQRSGKSRIFVNGEISTLTVLQKLCEGLIDICSQHEYQSLLKSPVQLGILDRFAECEPLAQEVTAQYAESKLLYKRIEDWKSNEIARTRQADFLQFQIDEIQAFDLQPGEEESLRQAKDLCLSSKQRLDLASFVEGALDSESQSCLPQLKSALQKARQLSALDPGFAEITATLENAAILTEDGVARTRDYLAQSPLDADEMTQVQERLSQLTSLKRKYGGSGEEVLATLERLKSQMAELVPPDFDLEKSEEMLATLMEKLEKKSRKLFDLRVKAAQSLSTAITRELKDLNMKDAALKIEVQWIEPGKMSVLYWVRANLGQEFAPLEKTASGGELSRILLSIRRVSSKHLRKQDHASLGIYLFDEVDTGIGGQTAFQVGKKLKSVSDSHQVLCITHLPQVAAFADHHYVVSKENKSGKTVTTVKALEKLERKSELARMLGGPTLSKKSLENAAELMSLAG